jgi:hypothetical protein
MPFRLVGVAIDGALGLVRGLVMLPARIVRGREHGSSSRRDLVAAHIVSRVWDDEK